jgi:hypothetical protein
VIGQVRCSTQFASFTSTEVQILTHVESRPFLRSALLLKLFPAQIVLVVDIGLKLLVCVALSY